MAAENANYYEYRIKAGDSLSLIITRVFGVSTTSAMYSNVMNHLLSINPQISNINHIRAGDILRLGVLPPQEKAIVKSPLLSEDLFKIQPYERNSFVTNRVHPKDMDDFFVLSWMASNANFLTVPGGITIGAKGNLLSQGNLGLIQQISDNYADYKNGKITRGQYDYARKVALDRLKTNIGPMDKVLFGDKTPHEAIRIARSGGILKTAYITKHIDRLTSLASMGKAGGYVLAGVGVAASCKQIADAWSKQEKNKIFVGTVASTTVGLASGAVIGLFLISNPVGWGTALVLAAGSAAVSYASGKGARKAYTLSGSQVDLVTGSGVASVCK
ncbi:MAG: hypothetical protein K6L73_09970 [Cellvibrionaceae bacterium]